MEFQYYLPTRLLFGAGTLNTLHEQALPGKRALVVTTGGQSVRKYGYLDRLLAQLDKAGCTHVGFDRISPNPNKDEVAQGAAAAREADCDFIVALGGGSVIDGAKAIALLATNPGDLWDYMHAGSGKKQPLAAVPLPLVTVCTTAGTGSEVNQIGVITSGSEKIGIHNPGLFPVLSVVDPELMVSLPPALTAYQGLDALFHNLEGYLSRRANPVTDLLALENIRKLRAHLPTAVRDGGDLAARTGVAYGSTMGGFVLALGGLTSQHAMEHSMSALHHALPHGAGLIMISRAYFSRWAAVHDPEVDRRMTELARAMGAAQPADPMDFVAALVKLEEECGVAALNMSDYGITREELADMAAHSKSTMPHSFRNDRVELSEQDVRAIFEESYR